MAPLVRVGLNGTSLFLNRGKAEDIQIKVVGPVPEATHWPAATRS
jgi:hypothetical protein